MSIQPQGEDMRNAVKWISEERRFGPEAPVGELIEKACRKFDLSPADAEFLARLMAQKNE